MMLKRLIILASFIAISSVYIKMASSNQLLSLYGNFKGYGIDCTLVDSNLEIHTYHIRKRDMGYGIHGCPIFVDQRAS